MEVALLTNKSITHSFERIIQEIDVIRRAKGKKIKKKLKKLYFQILENLERKKLKDSLNFLIHHM